MLEKLFVILISFGLVVLPLPKEAFAAQPQRSVAVLQVYRETPDSHLTVLRDKIVMFLKNRGDINVLAGEGDYNINQNAAGPTTGITLYEKAKGQFINFQFAEALSSVTQSIEYLKINPGLEGMLSKAHILKTGTLWELKDDIGALRSAMDATSYNLDLRELDEYYYSVKMINFYRDAYNKFRAEYAVTQMTIELANGSTAPIFVNGFLRGAGPEMTIDVPKGMTQIIQVGNNVYSYTPLNSKTAKNYYKIDATGYQASQFSTVSDTNFSYLASNAQSMGKSTGATQVAHIKTRKSAGKEEMLLKVVDTKTGFATETRYYLIKKFEDDADRIAKMASDFIVSLTSAQYFQQSYSYSWDLNEPDVSSKSYLKKPKRSTARASNTSRGGSGMKSTTILLIAGGVVLLSGLIAGIAVAAGGSSGSSSSSGGGGGGGSDTTSTTILSGPPP